VDLKGGVLTIRQSKFGKSRLVPLHPSAVEALQRYRTQRARHVRNRPVYGDRTLTELPRNEKARL